MKRFSDSTAKEKSTDSSNRRDFIKKASIGGLGDGIGLALDCGPGMLLSDAIRLANLLEPFNLMWCEDMLTGDYTLYGNEPKPFTKDVLFH